MFVADVKCSQATRQTVPNSQTGSAKASVSEALVHMWHMLSEEDRRDRRLPSDRVMHPILLYMSASQISSQSRTTVKLNSLFFCKIFRCPKISQLSLGVGGWPLVYKSKGVGLIVRAITFQDFQPMWSWSTNVTDRQTDRQTDRRHAIAWPHFAL